MELFLCRLVILLTFSLTEAGEDCQLNKTKKGLACCDELYTWDWLENMSDKLFDWYRGPYWEMFSAINTDNLKCCGTILGHGTDFFEDKKIIISWTKPFAKKCCGTLLYDIEINICCKNKIYDHTKGCCGGNQVYDLHPSICCYNKVESVDGEEDCCTPTPYNQTQVCGCGVVSDLPEGVLNMSQPSWLIEEHAESATRIADHCCLGHGTLRENGHVIDPCCGDEYGEVTFSCCGTQTISTITHTCCQGGIVSNLNHTCCEGKLETHDAGENYDKMRCCGDQKYNVEKKICSLDCNVVLNLGHPYFLVNHDAGRDYQNVKCCKTGNWYHGYIGYNAEKKICCSGQVIDRSIYGCCNNNKYDIKIYGCCNNNKYDIKTHGCCNSNTYNINTQGCCLKSKIYNRKTDRCCAPAKCWEGEWDYFDMYNRYGYEVHVYNKETQSCCYNMKHYYNHETHTDCPFEVYYRSTRDCSHW